MIYGALVIFEVIQLTNTFKGFFFLFIGCIFAELYLRKPIFCGTSEMDQLYKIFDVLGLPSEQDWPSQSPIPRSSFLNDDLKFEPREIETLIPNIDQLGKNLLLRLLNFNVTSRIIPRDALAHDYFKQEIKINDKDLSCDNALSSLPSDITNTFQPNILKRKRNSQANQQQHNQPNRQTNENVKQMDIK